MAPPATAAVRYRRAGEVAVRRIVGETILVPIRHQLADLECVYTLDEVGGVIWDLLDRAATLDEVVEEVVREFEVAPDEARADARRFLDGLLEAGLVSGEAVP